MSIINGSTTECLTVHNCIDTLSDPAYDRYLLDMEKNFDYCSFILWMNQYWRCIYVLIAAYLVAIYTGHRYMRHRLPYRLQGPLLAWNVVLAIFSICGAWRTVPALLYQIGHSSFHESICGGSSREYIQAIGFHIFLFHISKIMEFGDTAFIVARKSPLTLLHWFHHATVSFFVWSTSPDPSLIQVCFMAVNFFVHSIMYTYYALKVLKVRVPKAVSVSITLMQLLQMMIGVYITLYAYFIKSNPNIGCCVSEEALTIAMSIYVAYFALFLNFFFKSYFSKKSKVAASPKKLK